MDSQSTFKADTVIPNRNPTSKEPQCILDLPKCDTARTPLQGDELVAAKNDLVRKDFAKMAYAKKTMFNADKPISRQRIGLVTFVPSKGATPDQDGCFGVVKLRGNFSYEDEAETYAETIIRDYDSNFDIDFVHVGKYFPLMADNSIYTRETREIDTRKIIESTVQEAAKATREREQKELKSIEERTKKLTKTSTEETPVDPLEHFIELQVKKANCLMRIDECDEKKKESLSVLEKTSAEIDQIVAEHPEYKQEYLERYKQGLAAIGGVAAANPLIKYMTQN
jgi:hypothetical protein